MSSEVLSFVAILVFLSMGFLQLSLWPARLGGALFGTPSLARLVVLKNRYPDVPTNWRMLGFYAEAIVFGVGAGAAGYFMGYGIRAYW